MTPDFFHIDAFADGTFEGGAFAGNPAAVCLLEQARPDAWMSRMAAEMNLSETAFVVPASGGGAASSAGAQSGAGPRGGAGAQSGAFDLRWFTPTIEVDLCGHATLASAHALWSSGRVDATQRLTFATRSGPLHAERRGDEIELDFPARAVVPAEAPAALIEGLGLVPLTVARTSEGDLMALLPDAETVRSLAPDLGLLAQLDARGVIITARSDQECFDFVSRFFAPRSGVPEDPVTGSAHCALAPYWARRLKKSELVGFQASARGGVVRVRADGERVVLGGRAVTVVEGFLRV